MDSSACSVRSWYVMPARRGGYCFEQNTLLAAVLTTMGFRLYTTAARSVPDGKPQKNRQASRKCVLCRT